MFSDHDETSPSIAAVSAPSVVCSMLAMQQQKRLCRQFIDVKFDSYVTFYHLSNRYLSNVMKISEKIKLCKISTFNFLFIHYLKLCSYTR